MRNREKSRKREREARAEKWEANTDKDLHFVDKGAMPGAQSIDA